MQRSEDGLTSLFRAGETAHPFTALAAPLEDLGSSPATHMVAHNFNTVPSDLRLSSQAHMWCTHTHEGNILISRKF